MRSLDDRSLSVFALAVVAALGWPIVSGGHGTRVARPSIGGPPPVPFVSRVLEIADAIATAEGYYAPGEHDGHSLPYLLNNPGSLKATRIAGGELSTWGDTGLLVFPTREMGWTALRYQVCMMLTGTSRIYDLADTLVHVGVKYADGDVRWGPNVAARLGLPPDASLADLAAGTAAGTSSTGCLDIATLARRGPHAPQADVVD